MKTSPTTPYQPQENMIIWRPVVGFPRYRVSDRGEVLDTHKNRRLKQSTTPIGYRFVNLEKDGQRYMKKIHRLVAEAFIPNPNNLDTVDHINSNKTDNRASNLQWLSRVDNVLKSHDERGHNVERWFTGYYNGERIGRWFSQMDAAIELNLDHENVYKCLHDIVNSTHGFTFRYDD